MSGECNVVATTKTQQSNYGCDAQAAVNAKAINSGDNEVNESDSDIGTKSSQARR
jgi:hypothetical protein